MDVVDDAPARPGDIASTRILGWATFVKYRSSHVIECQVIDKWFRECSEITELEKPIMTKAGVTDKVVSVEINSDENCRIVNGNGELAFDKVFYLLPFIAPNGYAIGSDSPNEHNIFDLNNNCRPVFSTPFTKIYGGGFAEEGGEALLTAERSENGTKEIYYINAHGLEFNYDKWFRETFVVYEDKLMGVVNYLKERAMHFIEVLAAGCVRSIADEMVKGIQLDGLDNYTKKDLVGDVSYRLEHQLYRYIRNYIPSLSSQMPP
jgi:hypothetical protein